MPAEEPALPDRVPPDLTRSLQELEQQDWGNPDDPERAPTPLISTCLRLRRLPLRALTTEHLRMLIGQQVGTDYLVPLALQVLERDPLVEGDFYPGDLLYSVVRVAPDFWQEHPGLRHRLESVLDRAIPLLDEYSTVDSAILTAIDRLLASWVGAKTSGADTRGRPEGAR